MLTMLRHVALWRPTMVGATGGLAVGGITASVMALLHHLNATVMILIWNVGVSSEAGRSHGRRRPDLAAKGRPLQLAAYIAENP